MGDYLHCVSDHCPIFTTILKDVNRSLGSNENNLSNAQPGFVWKKIAKEWFLTGLKSNENIEKLNKLSHSKYPIPSDFLQKLTDILIDDVNSCKIKRKKVTNDKNVKSSPWFYKDCQTLKGKLKRKYFRLKKIIWKKEKKKLQGKCLIQYKVSERYPKQQISLETSW